MSFADHRFEVVVRATAVDHRATEVILRVKNELVAFLVLPVIVGVVRADELVIKLLYMLRALDKVVCPIDLLPGVHIEEARVPLGGGIVGQVFVVDARAKVELLEEGFALFGNGDQVEVSLVIILVAQGKPVNSV